MLVSLTPAITKNNYNRNNTASKQNPNFGQARADFLNAIKRSPGDALNNTLPRAIYIHGRDAYRDVIDSINAALVHKDIKLGPNARKTYKEMATNLEAQLASGN